MYCLFWICSGNYSSTVGFINNTIKREFHGGKILRRDLSEIIKEWKNEEGVEDIRDIYVNKKR